MIFLISLIICYIANFIFFGSIDSHSTILLGWTLAAFNHSLGLFLKKRAEEKEFTKFLFYNLGLNFLKLLFLFIIIAVILKHASMPQTVFIWSIISSYFVFLIEDIRKYYGSIISN